MIDDVKQANQLGPPKPRRGFGPLAALGVRLLATLNARFRETQSSLATTAVGRYPPVTALFFPQNFSIIFFEKELELGPLPPGLF